MASCGLQGHDQGKPPAAEQIFFLHPEITLDADHPGENHRDVICRQACHIHSTVSSQIVPCLPEEYPGLIGTAETDQVVSIPSASVMKRYLLHLFPSHYFW